MNPYQKSFSNSLYLKDSSESASPYLYNPKILHPQKVFPQMESEEYKPPFYFGGSQIPIANNKEMSGSGVYKPSKKLKTDTRFRTNTPITIPSINIKN